MILQDYLDLIPSQNSGQPMFMAWVAACIQPLVDAQALCLEMDSYFTLDKAVGVQLDILGQQLGQGRVVDFVPEGGVSATLNDDLYRLVLKARVLKNTWKGTNKETYDFWQKTFPLYPIVIVDNQNMTMSYSVYGLPLDPSALHPFTYDDPLLGYDSGYWTLFSGGLLRELFLHGYLTPKPEGVSVTYNFPTTAVFAYDQDSTYLKGYDAGTWI